MRLSPWVSHDRLDGEVMVINLKSGEYFAFGGAAADAWTMFVAGHGSAEVAEEVARRYEVDAVVAMADIERFAGALESEQLLEASADGSPPSPAELEEAGGRRPYEAPVIDKYEDLADLLLVDPIHEVGEDGWPTAHTGN